MNKYESSFKCDVWQDTIHIIISEDIKNALADTLRKHQISEKTILEEYTPCERTDVFVVTVKEPELYSRFVVLRPSTEVSSIVHESEHLTHDILSYRGIKHCDETDEVYAYTQQFIFNNIYNEFKIYQELNGKRKEEVQRRRIHPRKPNTQRKRNLLVEKKRDCARKIARTNKGNK